MGGYKMMCANIRSERSRMGGDWAVCCVLMNRKIRDVVRRELGEELHVICLDMEVEDMENRVRSRHAGDENNCSEVKVSPSMSPEDVAQIVLRKINATRED